MFIPFLPLMVALIVLSLLGQETSRPEMFTALSPEKFFVAFGMLSLLVGQISSRYIGSRQPIRFGPRRAIMMAGWVFMIYSWAIDLQLQSRFHPLVASELSTLTLVLVYWLGDSFCLDRIDPLTWRGMQEKLRTVSYHLRLQLPFVIVVIFLSGILQIFQIVLPSLESWEWTLVSWFAVMAIMLAASPFVMVASWGAKELESADAKQIIAEELTANGVSVVRILSWPEHIISTATAGVIGVFPGFRYLLISEHLILSLTPEELRAVIAHEAGHIRRHHLPFFVISFLILVLMLILAVSPLETLRIWIGADQARWIAGGMMLLGFIFFLRVALGFLSRNFERQADCNSLERVGLQPIRRALLKVGWLNGINPEEDNWHHYGIQQRVQFLAECDLSPEQISHHHRRVFRIKVACIALIAALVAGNLYAYSPQAQTQVFEMASGFFNLEEVMAAQPDVLDSIGRKATWYHDKKEFDQAEKLYRQVLSVDPNVAFVLNNLAWLLVKEYAHQPDKVEESLSLVQRAIEQESESAYIWDTLAESYYKVGDTQEAFNAAQQALSLAQQQKGVGFGANLKYYEDRLIEFRKAIESPLQ